MLRPRRRGRRRLNIQNPVRGHETKERGEKNFLSHTLYHFDFHCEMKLYTKNYSSFLISDGSTGNLHSASQKYRRSEEERHLYQREGLEAPPRQHHQHLLQHRRRRHPGDTRGYWSPSQVRKVNSYSNSNCKYFAMRLRLFYQIFSKKGHPRFLIQIPELLL